MLSIDRDPIVGTVTPFATKKSLRLRQKSMKLMPFRNLVHLRHLACVRAGTCRL
jgi:hypothetical protein